MAPTAVANTTAAAAEWGPTAGGRPEPQRHLDAAAELQGHCRQRPESAAATLAGAGPLAHPAGAQPVQWCRRSERTDRRRLSAAVGAYPSGLWLTEASLERQSGTGRIGFKAGVFALNPAFVEAPVLNAYVHSVLNNTLNLDVTGLPVNPYVAPGLRLTWSPGRSGRWGRWQAGAFWLDPQDELAGLFGVQTDAPVLRGAAQWLQWSYAGLPGHRQSSQPLALPARPVPRLLPPLQLQLRF